MPAELLVSILVATLGAATPLLLAATGELVVEKSGVLNLGVEGMMLVGAAVGFAAAAMSGSAISGVVAGMAAGMALSLVFGFLALTCLANQVATGLAVTIFGIGVSASIGAGYTGAALAITQPPSVPLLSALPVIGRIFSSLDALTYLALASCALVAWFLARTRAGLILRAIGDQPASAHAMGFAVIPIRYLAVLFGGGMAGLAGAYLSIFYTPVWVENMTAGRGWIAVALVVFATWIPWRVLLGSLLFGGVTILQFHVQGGTNLGIPTQFLTMLPYLATIVVLVAISTDALRIRLSTPASLGQPFHPEG